MEDGTATNLPTRPAAPTGALPAVDYSGLARDAYSASTTYFDSNIRKQVEASLRQFQGVHPTGSKYLSETYRARSRLFRPKTRSMVRKSEAVGAEALFATRDIIQTSAINDDDPKEQAGALLMKALLDYRLDRSIPWFLLACGAYQDAMVQGCVLSHQYWDWDPKRGIDKPCIDLIPLENFRFDPGAQWVDPIGTSPYNIRLVPIFVKDALARMRTGRWLAVSPADLMAAAMTNADTTRMQRERGRSDSTQNATAINNFSVIWVHQNVVEVEGMDMLWWTLAGNHRLLTQPVPLEREYRHCKNGKRPFVMGFSAIETHKTYPDGPVGFTRDVQAEINEVTNQRIDNVKFAMNKRYFAKRGAQVDLRSLTRNTPGSVTLMNDVEKDVLVVDTPDVTASAFQEQDRLNLDFDDLAGLFSPSSVQSNRKLNETVGGMKLLNVNTNQVGAYQLKTFTETWGEPVLRQLADLEAFYETDDGILEIAGKQAGLMADFGIQVIEDELLHMERRVRIDINFGATNPQEQVNNFMLGMRALKELLADGVLEKYGLAVREIITELFSKLGYRDGKRFFPSKQDPALLAALQTVQQLQQQLSQKTDPEMVQAQIRKINAEVEGISAKNWDTRMNALESAVRSHFASMQTAQGIAAVPALAPVADAVLDSAATMSGNQPTAGMVEGPAQPLPGLTQNPVKNPRSGIEFNPAAAGGAGGAGAAPGDTTPQTPANPGTGAAAAPMATPQPATPASPGTGGEAGINTERTPT